MLNQGRKLQFLEVELTPYTFGRESLTPIPNRLEPYSSEGSALQNCLAGFLHGFPLIRSGTVNSDSKVKQLLSLAKMLHKKQQNSLPLRVVFDQSQSVEFEWDMIHEEHQSIVHRSEHTQDSIHHLCSAADPLVSENPPSFKVKSTLDILDQMPKILNVEAWADFCLWFGLRLQEILKEFPYDAVDAYTLEKHLQDFLHETHSPFLKRVRQHLLMLQLLMGYPEEPAQASFNQEKEVIKARYEMQKLIRDHYKVLVKIVHVVEMIGHEYPELEPVLRAGIYLRELIGPEVNDENQAPVSWGRGQLLKQLFCAEFNAIPVISSCKGLGRTHFAFAIRAAAMTMRERLRWPELKHFVLNWNEMTVLVNRLAAKQGKNGIEDPSLNLSARHVIEFRELVFNYLRNFCLPISSWNRKGDFLQLTGNEFIDPGFLNFLPAFREDRPLITYDYASGFPSGLTEEGLKFYAEIN
ncbi:putative uncharacterized protein [Waddlia chondrophila 2032/99]|uniref:Uncharacterized protein n=1 Tax=Waddlia chondrophila 2032/99 TaxID=765953 RepID=F8LDY1_9BACT|nr:putative uncharacterized protein [Waddlia chondrophila 2032/99]